MRNICVTNDHIYVLFVVITIWLFPHSCHDVFVTLVTRRMFSIPPVLSGVPVAQSLVFNEMFCPYRSLFFLLSFFLLTIVLSVLLRFTASDYHFGIFWPLCCLSFFDLRLLITHLTSSNLTNSLPDWQFKYVVHMLDWTC